MYGECSTSPVTRGSSPHPFMPDLEIDVGPFPTRDRQQDPYKTQYLAHSQQKCCPARLVSDEQPNMAALAQKEPSSCQACLQRTAGCDRCGKEGYKPGPAFAPLPPLVYNRSVFWNRVDGVSTWPHHDISLLVPRH